MIAPSAKAVAPAPDDADRSAKWKELRSQIGDLGKQMKVVASSSAATARAEENLASFNIANGSGVSRGSLEEAGNEVVPTVSRASQLFTLTAPDDDLLVTMGRSIQSLVTVNAEEEPVHTDPEVMTASGTVDRVSNIEPIVKEPCEPYTL